MINDNDELERLRSYCQQQESIINRQDEIIKIARDTLMYCLRDKDGEIKVNSITMRSNIGDTVSNTLKKITKMEFGMDDFFDTDSN